MIPRIEKISEKKLVGKRITTSFMNNKTSELWRSFMPRRSAITNWVSTDLISMEIYGSSFDFRNFNPEAPFEKWAAAEVSAFEQVPEDMETFHFPGGLYAVFLHIGPASTGPKTFQYIFGNWLPGAEYLLDIRPHFEVMGPKYQHEAQDSEEELWIPVKPK